MGIFNHEKKEKINYLNNLISIIVPIYNAKDTLERCLKSLISQSYKNIEIICIDDASTDASSLLLEAFATKDKRIKIIKNKENKGIAYCRNIGLKAAVGEYIMWCDSDDWYEKDMCKEMYLAITENNADLVNCSQNVIKDKSLKYRLLLEKYCNWNLVCHNVCVEKIDDIYHIINRVLWNKIFKKSLLDKYNIEFLLINNSEDCSFVLKYVSVCKKIYFLDKKLYNYVRYENSSYMNMVLHNANDQSGLNAIDDVRNFLYKNKIKYLYDSIERIYNDENNNLLDNINKNLYISSQYFEMLKQKLKQPQKKEELKTKNKNKIKSLNDIEMNIFFATNEKYLEPLVVCITSIILSSNKNEKFNFYIITDKLSDESIKVLNSMNKKNKVKIEVINITKKRFDKLPSISYFSKYCYFRYLIPELKPELDKALYLDCDIVVLNSLYELYTTDLKDNYAGVVQDACGIDGKNKKKYLFNLYDYFNSGVMLMNLEKMRKDNITNQCFNITYNLAEFLQYPDQDILNLIFEDKIVFVPLRFNLQGSLYLWDQSSIFSKEELEDRFNNPVVVHFNLAIKPWMKNCIHPLWYKYFEFLKKSPLKNNLEKYKELFFSIK